MHVFMDAFQGWYRTHPRDLRFFSAFYLLLRVLLMIQWYIFFSDMMIYTSGILSLVSAAVIAVFQPYKVTAHNRKDVVLFLMMGIYFVSYHEHIIKENIVVIVTEALPLSLLLIYFLLLVAWKTFLYRLVALVKKAIRSMCNLFESSRSEEVESFQREIDDESDMHNYPPLLEQNQTVSY